MTNKPMLSVERELVEKAALLLEIHSDRPSLETCVADDLRSLLDKSSTCAESQVEPAAQQQGEPVACNHEWTDDGQFLLVCTTCGAQEDYTQALQLAFELGGTDDGSYDLEADELCEVIRRHAEQPAPVALTVWYGSMPESNGKTNWTAILHRKGGEGSLISALSDGITIDRSEYPDRVRYEADRMRYLIGELAAEPFILDYDAEKHSGYAKTEKSAPEGIPAWSDGEGVNLTEKAEPADVGGPE